ncbi:MAG: universal stress protein [Alphaproteobacteria bacterium]|nr:universal stress protein [Alphaproteobacteria bacterium]
MKDHHVVLVTWAPALHGSTLELATRLAARLNAVLLFVHVVPCRPADGEAMLYSALEVIEGRAEAWVRSLTPSAPGVRFRHRFEVGDPEEILQGLVDAHPVDLVVAEEPPRSWMSKTLWRGVAERLVHRLACPVVIGGPRFLHGAPAPVHTPRIYRHPVDTADLLNALVEARVEAIRAWMDWQAEVARRILGSQTVETVLAMAETGQLPDTRLQRRLQVELDEYCRAQGAVGWHLRTSAGALPQSTAAPAHSPALTAFFQRLQRLGQTTSLPLRQQDDPDRLIVLAGARTGSDGVLLLFFNAEDDFLRILGQPGPLPSLETYAFDSEGMMLSNSLFPDHLHAAGLLPADGCQTPLRLRVAEPSAGPADQWPLTRMARQATRHEDGFDTRGYLDYRGTPVVGAWRWVAEYGFGVTAEVDHRVVYRSRGT